MSRREEDGQEFYAALDQRIGGAIGVFVPAVGRSDEHAVDHALNLLDLAEELIAREVAAVQGLGSDCDAIDGVLVARNGFGDCICVCLEGFIGISPMSFVSTRFTFNHMHYETNQMPRMTLKPAAAAAGRMFPAVSQLLPPDEYVRTSLLGVWSFSAWKSCL